MVLPFKAIAVDMDGTFLDDNHQFDHQLFDSLLSELELKDIHFIVASGRPFARLKADFGDFAQRIDFVSANGSRLISKGTEANVIGLKKKETLDIIDFVQKKYGKVSTLVYARKTAYINKHAPEEDNEFLAYFAKNVKKIADWTELPEGPYIEITFRYDSSVAQDIEKMFNEKYGKVISTFASAERAIDITRYGVDKASGLELLLKDFNINGQELIAFGDGGNDIPMLDFAKYSYAMENGMKSAKDHAKFIAPSNNQNGVLRTIKSYLEADK